MVQAKIRVTLNDGTSFEAPEQNYNNIRRMLGEKIVSCEGIDPPVIVAPVPIKVLVEPARVIIPKKAEPVKETEYDKNIKKITDAGFKYHKALRIYEKGTVSITEEELATIKPMPLGKLIKKTN